jgi:hypothetical protein
MTLNNCLFWALRRWWQYGTAHSYLIIRKSRHTWLPHVMWTKSIDDVYVEEYKPVDPAQGKLFRRFPFPALMFRGRVRRGWGEEGERTKVGR